MLETLLTCGWIVLGAADVPANVDVLALKRAAEQAHSSTLGIQHDGKVVGMWTFDGPERVINVQSITKSVTALVLGPLMGQPRLENLDAKLVQFFPQFKDDARKTITLRHLLTHTTGLAELPDSADTWKLAPNCVALAASARLQDPPGTHFNYSSKASNLLGDVIAQVSRQPLIAWSNRVLFSPLNIVEAPWMSDPTGHPWVSGGLALDVKALLSIGQLMLDKGQLGGKQVIAKAWVDELVKNQRADNPTVGLFWWLHTPTDEDRAQGEEDAYFAHGYMGQFIVVVPKRKLVVVRQYDMMQGMKVDGAAFVDFVNWVARLRIET